MKTFVFVAIKAGKQDIIKCRIYEKQMNLDEIKTHVFENETLLTFEYANVCTF